MSDIRQSLFSSSTGLKNPLSEDALSENSLSENSANDFRQYIERAKSCVEQAQWDEAIAAYKSAIKTQPVEHIWIYLALGPLLVKQGNVDDAIACYKKALALNPDNAKTYTLVGLALEQKGLLSESIASYRRAISIAPQPAWVHQKLGSILGQRSAEDCLQSAVSYLRAMHVQDRFSSYDRLHQTLSEMPEQADVTDKQQINSLWQSLERQDLASAQFAKQLAALGFLKAERSPVNPAGYYFVNENLKTVYCSIPKNACTLFKNMLVDNSLLKEEFDASQKNIHAFLNQKIPDTSAHHLLSCLHSPEYFKFVVLRNPFRRLVSGYLDKFAKHVVPEAFAREVIANVQTALGLASDVEKSITFSQFVDYLVRTPDSYLNDHWRPQHNFIASVQFDFIGQFEAIDSVVSHLEDTLRIDIRKQVSSHVTQYRQFDTDFEFWNMYPYELRALGGMPRASQMFSEDLKLRIQSRYRQDIQAYEQAFDVLPNSL